MPHSTIQLKASPGVYESSVVKGHGFSRLQSMMELQEIQTANRLIDGRVKFCKFKIWKRTQVYKISFVQLFPLSALQMMKSRVRPWEQGCTESFDYSNNIPTCCNFQCVDTSTLQICCKICYTSPSDLTQQTWLPGRCRPHSNSQCPPVQFGRDKKSTEDSTHYI